VARNLRDYQGDLIHDVDRLVAGGMRLVFVTAPTAGKLAAGQRVLAGEEAP
jgi:hypothetical protein